MIRRRRLSWTWLFVILPVVSLVGLVLLVTSH